MSPPVPPALEDDYRLPDNCVTYFVAGLCAHCLHCHLSLVSHHLVILIINVMKFVNIFIVYDDVTTSRVVVTNFKFPVSSCGRAVHVTREG